MTDRFGQLLAYRDHLRFYLEAMDIRLCPGVTEVWPPGWAYSRAANACRLLNVEEELQAIALRIWPGGFTFTQEKQA